MSRSSYRFLVLLILVGGLPIGVTWLFGFVPRSSIDVFQHNSAVDQVRIEAGKAIFQRRCAGCHAHQHRGPKVSTISQNASRRKPELPAEHYLLESILEPAKFKTPGYSSSMPEKVAAGLTADEIRSVIYYLLSFEGEANWEKIAALEITPLPEDQASTQVVDRAQVERGRVVFEQKGGCAKCHLLHVVPGMTWLAPSIFGVGVMSDAELREAIFEPHKKILASYQQAVVQMPDGRLIQGRILAQNPDEISLLIANEQGVTREDIRLQADADGELPVVKILSDTSSMPGNYAEILSRAEQADLLAFLRTLVGGG